MDDVVRSMWKGGTKPTDFPHVCPYSQDGVDKKRCIELSGRNFRQNKDGCCGTQRGSIRFEPCNSEARRCIVCLEMGRPGLKANAVTNVKDGTCDEHATGASYETRREFRLPATPVRGSVKLGGVSPSRRAAPVLTPRPPIPAPSKPAAAPQDAGPTPAKVLSHKQYDLVDELDAEEILVLQKLSHGYSEAWVADQLRTMRPRVSDRSVETVLQDVYRKLAIEPDRADKMRRAACSLYLCYDEMNRGGVDPLVEDEEEAIPDVPEQKAQEQAENLAPEEPAPGDPVPPESSAPQEQEEVGGKETQETAPLSQADADLDILADRAEALTPRQREVLQHLAAGLKTNADVARAMSITASAVEQHLVKINRILQIRHLTDSEKRAIAVRAFQRFEEKRVAGVATVPEDRPPLHKITLIEMKPDTLDLLLEDVSRGGDASELEAGEKSGQEEIAAPTVPVRVVAGLSDLAIDKAAVRVGILDEGLQEVLRMCAEGLDNSEIAKKRNCKYSAVSSAMTAIYKMIGIQWIYDIREKRLAAGLVYKRFVERRHAAGDVGPIATESPTQAATGQYQESGERFADLESHLNSIIDEAEAALRLIGGKRRKSEHE